MKTTMFKRRAAALVCAVAATGILPVFAQQTKPHLNVVQRHPTAAGVVAAAATHHALKVKAAHDKAAGKKLNFAERHPTMTAVGAGLVVHHVAKKSAEKKMAQGH